MTSTIAQHQSMALPLPGKRVLIAALAIALTAAASYALRSQALSPRFLHIDSMQVYGQLRWVDREELTAAAQPFLNSNFFSADLAGIKQAVESLPWVASASVRRQWPNQLHIAIHEHRAAARWQEGVLISDQGELFEPAEIPAELAGTLVQLHGPTSDAHELFVIYQELLPLFAGAAVNSIGDTGLQIAKIHMNERRALELELRSGMRIIFGRMGSSADLSSAAARYFKALGKDLGERIGDIAVVDLRYTNGFAVQWKGGEAHAEMRNDTK